jgi:alpha-aminoadipate carrier protein LysW
MSAAACPECEAEISVEDDVLMNEVLECGECRSELEVVTTSPVLLGLAPEVQEDWGE